MWCVYIIHAYLIRPDGSSSYIIIILYRRNTSNVDIRADLAVFKIKKTYLVADWKRARDALIIIFSSRRQLTSSLDEIVYKHSAAINEEFIMRAPDETDNGHYNIIMRCYIVLGFAVKT